MIRHQRSSNAAAVTGRGACATGRACRAGGACDPDGARSRCMGRSRGTLSAVALPAGPGSLWNAVNDANQVAGEHIYPGDTHPKAVRWQDGTRCCRLLPTQIRSSTSTGRRSMLRAECSEGFRRPIAAVSPGRTSPSGRRPGSPRSRRRGSTTGPTSSSIQRHVGQRERQYGRMVVREQRTLVLAVPVRLRPGGDAAIPVRSRAGDTERHRGGDGDQRLRCPGRWLRHTVFSIPARRRRRHAAGEHPAGRNAVQLDDRGDVIGTTSAGAPAIEMAARAGSVTLPLLHAGDSATPSAISDSGEVVGTETVSGVRTPVVWSGGAVVTLTSLVSGGLPAGVAPIDVNNRGSILVSAQDYTGAGYLLEPGFRVVGTILRGPRVGVARSPARPVAGVTVSVAGTTTLGRRSAGQRSPTGPVNTRYRCPTAITPSPCHRGSAWSGYPPAPAPRW